MNTMTALLNSGEIDAATVLSDFQSLGEAYDRSQPYRAAGRQRRLM
jgi:hypothetical protein